jgi:hypothetical protein
MGLVGPVKSSDRSVDRYAAVFHRRVYREMSQLRSHIDCISGRRRVTGSSHSEKCGAKANKVLNRWDMSALLSHQNMDFGFTL